MSVPAGLRREVTRRAGNQCEYCRLAQAGQEAAFHVDHVHPVAERGGTVLGNLALACVSCSLRKGARRFARDPLTGKEVRLFHPRDQSWQDHFVWQGTRVQGLTATGARHHQLAENEPRPGPGHPCRGASASPPPSTLSSHDCVPEVPIAPCRGGPKLSACQFHSNSATSREQRWSSNAAATTGRQRLSNPRLGRRVWRGPQSVRLRGATRWFTDRRRNPEHLPRDAGVRALPRHKDRAIPG